MPDTARIDRFRAMVERFPDSEVPRYSLAGALLEAGQTREAVEHLRALLEMKPNYMMAHVRLSNALYTDEKFDEALVACLAAIEVATAQDHKGPLLDCERLLEEIREELPGIC